MRPATTGLLDQADAATRHAHALVHALADREHTNVRHGRPGPVTTRIVAAMRTRMLGQALAGQATLCPHLRYDGPGLAFWAPHAPGRLRCPDCHARVIARMRGTREDRTCDGCRTLVAVIHPCVIQLPALVVDLGPAGATAAPPIAVHYGLCARCLTTDTPEETS